MIQKKNKLMLLLSLGAVLLSCIVHVLQRGFQLFADHHMSAMQMDSLTPNPIGLNIMLLIPIILLFLCGYLYMRIRKDHPYIPVLISLVLTFSSISIIAGSGGSVEFHFSIFMVIATVAYYESIGLILLMTVLFAVQHIAGFYMFPSLVYGMSATYMMLIIHGGFLVLTSAATSLQIRSKLKITQELETDRAEKEKQLVAVLERVKRLTDQLEQTSATVAEKSNTTIEMNEEMNTSFKEVAVGLKTQRESVSSIEHNLHDINNRIVQTAYSSEEIRSSAAQTGAIVTDNDQQMKVLFEQIVLVAQSIETATATITSLYESSQKVEGIIATVQEVANQTHLLALNAAIEAARAGEQGKGFAVVAAEIRKLAERSGDATREVQSILSLIREESLSSVEQIEKGQEATDLSVIRAKETIAGFERMNEDLKHMIKLVHHLDGSIQSIQSASIEIAGEISNINAITQQSAAAVEDLFKVSETQMSSSKEVDDEIVQLKEISQSLYKQFSA
ncbi:methyl-accepting chemotaxis protein [Paenibacillus cellulosilyticus]|nr:methyl-accepting chemotaxis protein [Paenibacillus cellulosilyticus]